MRKPICGVAAAALPSCSLGNKGIGGVVAEGDAVIVELERNIHLGVAHSSAHTRQRALDIYGSSTRSTNWLLSSSLTNSDDPVCVRIRSSSARVSAT